MIFSKQYPGAILIQKESLKFFLGGEEQNLQFTPDTISNGEITDPGKYGKTLQEFILNQDIKKQPVLLVLSDEILFKKTLPAADMKLLDEKMADFTGMIALDNSKITKKSALIDNNISLFAVNKDFFEPLMEYLEKTGFNVLAVVPFAPFALDNEFAADYIKRIYDDKKLLEKTNFLTASPESSKSFCDKKTLGLIFFLIITVIVMSFLLVKVYLKTDQAKPKAVPTTVPQTTISPEPEPATNSASLSKEEIRISIFNGTGIAGQAGKLKDLLTNIGFAKIETGNAEGAKANETVVVFSPAISEDTRQEITDLLNENFEGITEQENASGSADIIITTGAAVPQASGD